MYDELLGVYNYIPDTSKAPLYFGGRGYKSLVKPYPDFMWDFYTIKPVLKIYLLMSTFRPKLMHYGQDFLIFHGNLLWNNLPTYIKISESLTDFKNYLRNS